MNDLDLLKPSVTLEIFETEARFLCILLTDWKRQLKAKILSAESIEIANYESQIERIEELLDKIYLARISFP